MRDRLRISPTQLLIYFLYLIIALTIINISYYQFYRKVIIVVAILIFISCLALRTFSGDYARTIIIEFFLLGVSLIIYFINPNAGLGATLNIILFISLHMLMKIEGISSTFVKYLTILFFIESIYIASISKTYGALHYASYMDGTNQYVNTNYLAYMICIMSFQVWSYLKNTAIGKKKIGKLLDLSLLLLNIWTISNLNSRSSYIAILFFLALVYIYPNKLITKNKILLMYIILIVLTIIIPIGYVYMYRNGIKLDTIGAISKNTFTGREMIWKEYVSHFSSIGDWIFGLGSQTTILGGADMHNATLTLIKNGGVLSASILYIYIGRQIIQCVDETITRERFVYLASVLAAIPIGCFESIFSTSQFFCIFVLLLYQAQEQKSDNIVIYGENL